MKKTKSIFYLVITALLIIVTIASLKFNKETTLKRVYQYDKETPISVKVDTLKLESAKTANSFTGIMEPNRETKLNAEVQGKINSLLVDIGSDVKKGQALIQLDNALLKFQLQAMEIQIDGLHTDVNRFTILANAEAVQGVQLEKSLLALKSAMVQKATLVEQINKTTIIAPFEGIITAKLTEEGAFATPGIPLLQITDISKLRFSVNVPEQKLKYFRLSQTAKLTVDAYPDLEFTAKIIMIGSKANFGNSFPVQFLVENTSDLMIKSGMLGKVSVGSMENQKQIIILASSVIGTHIKPQVYVVIEGKAWLRDIKIAQRIENMVVIESGLAEYDVIVNNGFINLFDGANVTIK